VQGRKLFTGSTFPIAVLIGLALAAPAGAQELVDVAALESRLEAAGELAELPTEPDWGVADTVGSDPTASADAPQVPVASATEAPAPEPSTTEAPAGEPAAVDDSEEAAAARYHTEEPQYHAEYHASEPARVTEAPRAAPDPVVPPAKAAPEAALATAAALAQAAQSEPARTEPPPTESRATEPAAPPTSSPAPASAPTPVQEASTPVQEATSATPTIWIWIWNWNWTTVADGRYHDSVDQYQIDESILGTDVPKSVASSVRMPAQIDLQTGVDIVDKIQRGITPVEAVREAQREARAITLEATQEVSVQARDLGVEAEAALVDGDAVLEETEAALERVFRPLRPSSAGPPTAAGTVAVRAEARTTARAARKRDAHGWTAATSGSAHTHAHARVQVASSSASYFASGDAARSSRHAKRSPARPHMHRAAAPKPPLTTNEERLADAGSASGGGVGFLLKTIAVLTAFMLLAALGYGFRIWLPVTRLRGLLGARTDPPG
jgi:hypothetical protein